MFSIIAKYTGQLLGETVHQTGNLISATGDGISETFDDICNIPSAFAKGYEEEIFESKPETPTQPQSNVYVEPAK